ncbi:MAG: NAD(P)/FAD-dependent oxidoreductase [Chloroflexi bacterium]|nr:NAD(P)/FAD-dependent oxidoreductase [Chloroflexota bacterium]
MAVNGRQRIVVLGGGSGGLVAATRLGRRLGADHEVVLIDRSPEHVYMPSLLWVMVGQRQPGDITRKLARLEHRSVHVVQAQIEGIEPHRQEVVTSGGPVGYDHLIISLGLQPAPEQIPGFVAGADHAWEMGAALQLREKLRRFERGRVVIAVPPGPYRCPPAPYETQYLLDSYFRERGIRERVEMTFYTRDPAPRGPSTDPSVWMDTQARARGIGQHYSYFVESIDPEQKVMHGRYGLDVPYDLLFMIPPHRPAQPLIDSHIADSLMGVRVDYDTLETRWDNVYAIGDCADMPASKAGVVAHQEADVVAHNIEVTVTRRGHPETLRLHTM